MLSDIEKGNNIVQHIVPNPAGDNLTIRYIMATPADEVSMELTSTLGAVVFSATLPKQISGLYDLPLDLRGVSNGLYLLKVRSNSNVETHRIMVAR